MFPACSQRYQKRDVTVLISFDFLTVSYSLWFLFTLQKCPPLTKGFREEEQNNDSIRLFSLLFFSPLNLFAILQEEKKSFRYYAQLFSLLLSLHAYFAKFCVIWTTFYTTFHSVAVWLTKSD